MSQRRDAITTICRKAVAVDVNADVAVAAADVEAATSTVLRRTNAMTARVTPLHRHEHGTHCSAPSECAMKPAAALSRALSNSQPEEGTARTVNEATHAAVGRGAAYAERTAVTSAPMDNAPVL